jgi:hypothetical protein
LRAQRRRVGRAYADGAFDEAEYATRLEEIDARIAGVEVVAGPELEPVAALVADLGRLWECATAAERQLLLEPLIDRAYIDLDTKSLVRVAPAPAFGALLRAAARRTKRGRAAIEILIS